MKLTKLAPVDYKDGIYLKRCDTLDFLGAKGGKAEGAYNIIQSARERGFNHFVTVGSRLSPQCEIVSTICDAMGCKCDIFMPAGESVVAEHIDKHENTTLHRFSKGSYTNVLISYAKQFSSENQAYFIPFGMVCSDNVATVSRQVKNIPAEIKRIVVPVGSGCTMAGIIKGLNTQGRTDIRVIGVITGSRNSINTVKRYNPPLLNKVKYSFVEFDKDLSPAELYNRKTDYSVGDVKLDPIYEGKCYKHLQAGDLLWLVGYHDV